MDFNSDLCISNVHICVDGTVSAYENKSKPIELSNEAATVTAAAASNSSGELSERDLFSLW